MINKYQELERIANSYHLNDDVPDKFIELACQDYCCDWLASLIDPADDVLELGYGDGRTLERLNGLGSSYTLIDGALTLIEKARSKFPSVEVVHGFFEDYSPHVGYDKVLALHVLEHVEDPVSLLVHMSKWLKSGGELIVVVPNAESLHRQLAVVMGLQDSLDTLSPRDHVVGHQRVYTMDMLKDHLDQAGYRVVGEKGFFLKFLPNSMMIDFSLDLIKALNVVGESLSVGLMANIAVRAVLKE